MIDLKTLEELKNYANSLANSQDYRKPLAWGIGRVYSGQKNKSKALSVDYASVNYKECYASATIFFLVLEKFGFNLNFQDSEMIFDLNLEIVNEILGYLKFLQNEAHGNKHRNLQALMAIRDILEVDENSAEFCVTFVFSDEEPKSVECVYLKLYLLSLSKVPLRSINLNGAFSILPNVAWDEKGKPIELEWLRENEIKLKMKGIYPNICSVDKFPRYLSHIIPADNVRILDSAKVRMGAQIAPGTTIMPGASYVNFNAGTTGAVMVEGRVSSSVIVGDGSDVGGGASILGVLSGTNGNPVSIGKKCLLGANSVTGIPLGDGCIVDGGIAVLEGTKVYISEKSRLELGALNPNFAFDKEIYKALELANLNGLHFRQDSQSGKMIVTASKRAIKLNEDLH